MTTLPIIPLAAMLAAVATLALALLFLRRLALEGKPGPGAKPDSAAPAPGELHVPFTHLGVEVEAPPAPDWSMRGALDTPVALSTSAPGARAAHPPLALDHIDRATAILHEHVLAQPSATPAAWLMLLELYRTHGREQAMADLAHDFGMRFRAQGNAVRRGGADGGLEAFPPAMKLVTMLWGTHECRDLLERLQRDRGEGRRLGLSRAAYVDIATLRQLLETLLAELDADRAEEVKVREAWAAANEAVRR